MPLLDGVVESVKRIAAKGPAYNLLVSPGGTYLANGIVVHNKGCFLPETLIRKDGRLGSPHIERAPRGPSAGVYDRG